MSRLVTDAICLPRTGLPELLDIDDEGLKKALSSSLTVWPPAAPPPYIMMRLAAKDHPELSGSIPRRAPKYLGFPAVTPPGPPGGRASRMLSVCDRRSTKTSYCHPSRVS